jgi:RNA polymerase sigma-70 factor (ECF subfamily)
MVLRNIKAEPPDDAGVVKKILRGQPELFGVILERYQRPIFNFIYRFYGNYDLAEDLTQETFLRCYQFLKSYDQKRKFSTWLYTVARNLCIDHLKRHKSGREISLDQTLPAVERREAGRSPEASPQIKCIRNQEDARLLEALGELEPSRRMVLILFYFQGLSYQEISETLSVPVSTVKIRIFRAKKSLLEKMKGRDGPAEPAAGKRA